MALDPGPYGLRYLESTRLNSDPDCQNQPEGLALLEAQGPGQSQVNWNSLQLDSEPPFYALEAATEPSAKVNWILCVSAEKPSMQHCVVI